jgi:hypothetical protein
MVDRVIAVLVLVVIPATILVTSLQLISIEFGLALLWATVLVSVVVGVVEYLKNPEAYDRLGRSKP